MAILTDYKKPKVRRSVKYLEINSVKLRAINLEITKVNNWHLATPMD